jgi:hypothetical protein
MGRFKTITTDAPSGHIWWVVSESPDMHPDPLVTNRRIREGRDPATGRKAKQSGNAAAPQPDIKEPG